MSKFGLALWVKSNSAKSKLQKLPKFQKLQKNQRSKKWEKTTFTVSDLNIRTGAVCRFATTAPTEPYKSSASSELRPHTVQGANANQAKLEDSAQLAQVIALVNELREALVEKGLIKGSV